MQRYLDRIRLPATAHGPLFLMIETKARELDAKLLLAAKALADGYVVFLGRKGSTLSVAEAIGRGVVLDKDHGDNRGGDRARRLKEAGIVCAALDEEGLVFPSEDAYRKERQMQGLTAFQYLDATFVWGQNQRDMLSSWLIEDYSKTISITGNPRLDLLQKPVSNYFKGDVIKIKRKFSRYILVNTNFQAGNYARFYGRSYVDEMRHRGKVKNSEDEKFYLERSSYFEALFNYYADLIRKLSKNYPDIRVVVRPHPSEDYSAWSEVLRELSNVSVVGDGNITPWILGASAVIHTSCTTGIESFIAGVPVLRYHPVYDTRFEKPLPNHFGEGFSNTKDLIDRIICIYTGNCSYSRDESKMDYLTKHASNANKEFAYKKIMGHINHLLSSRSVLEKNSFLVLPRYSLNKRAFTWFRRFVSRGFIGRSDFLKQILYLSIQKSQKFPTLTPGEVHTGINGFREVIPSLNTCRYGIKEVSKDTIMVYPKPLPKD